MNLSKTQLLTLKNVRHANDYGKEAYLETGRYKPFNTNTIKSLEKRKLIVVTAKSIGGGYYADAPIYYATITPAGRRLLENL